MKTLTIDGHTFCPELLSDGWVIDAGCRGWNFSNALLELGYKDRILAMDIENFTDVPEGVKFIHAGLSNTAGYTEAHYFGNGTGNFIKGLNGAPGDLPDRPCETKPVQLYTLDNIYDMINSTIDMLKLDIEGAEYLVLDNLESFPRMITVETHEHCHHDLHDKHWNKIFEHLCRYYHCNLYIREWPMYKFMDCLFIRKDLI